MRKPRTRKIGRRGPLAISGGGRYAGRQLSKIGSGIAQVMNRFERLGFKGEAKLRYLDGEVQILTPGDFVRCAVTGKSIPLEELRYWSVELQEPYADAAASLQRYREVTGK